jgi:hypothetical protein
MPDRDGAGTAEAQELIATAAGEPSSLDGLAVAPEPFADRPEVLLAAVFLAGLLIGGLVSRLGR